MALQRRVEPARTGVRIPLAPLLQRIGIQIVERLAVPLAEHVLLPPARDAEAFVGPGPDRVVVHDEHRTIVRKLREEALAPELANEPGSVWVLQNAHGVEHGR